MQGIILAAGKGTRLGSLTKNRPKALIEVLGKPIIINTLEILKLYGIKEVIIIIGYLGEVIQKICGENFCGMKITYVYNELYEITNNNYSLYLAKDFIKEDVVLIECDLIFQEEVIKELVQVSYDCAVLVSKYNKESMDGTIVYADDFGNINKMLLKRNQVAGEDYKGSLKTVNIYKFSYEFWRNVFMTALENYIFFHDKSSYYEVVLGALIFYGDSEIRSIEVDEKKWAEIDNLEDLKRAEQRFSLEYRNELVLGKKDIVTKG